MLVAYYSNKFASIINASLMCITIGTLQDTILLSNISAAHRIMVCSYVFMFMTRLLYTANATEYTVANQSK